MLLAVEDSLSEAVTRKIFAVVVPHRRITLCLGLKGKSYLAKKADNLNQAAKGSPIFLLADLDDSRLCPVRLIESWLKGPRHPNFLFRIAVMEIESWLMADREALAKFLLVPLAKVPTDPDAVPNPKEFLVSLARHSRSSRLRQDLVPAPGGTSKVGPGYNLQFTSFVKTSWQPEAAASSSPSLQRTLRRLREHAMTSGV